MKIHILRCGSVGIARAPVFAYLVEHPKGLVLIDTGWSRELQPAGKPSKGALPTSVRLHFRPELPSGEAVAERLGKLGLTPRDLDIVLLTQLTSDHVCGLRDLAGAKKMLVSENERFWSCRTVFSRLQPRSLWEGTALDIFYMRGAPFGPRRLSYDLFGDGSFLLTETPGCTFGQTSAVIYSGAKYALISSDIAASADDLRAGRLAGHLFAPGMARKSLDWLQKMALAPECAACLVNHDAGERRETVIF